jgi:hypothetical protein
VFFLLLVFFFREDFLCSVSKKAARELFFLMIFLLSGFLPKISFFTSTKQWKMMGFACVWGCGSLLSNELELYPEVFPATITSKKCFTMAKLSTEASKKA